MQNLVGEERREFQRLDLTPTVEGTLGGKPVVIHEIGVLGARVRHAEPMDDEYADLVFKHADHEITLKCEIVRRRATGFDGNDARESGLRFLAAVEESGDRLRTMLAALVTDAIDSRRRNAPPSHLNEAIDGDKTVRGRDAGYLCYRLENGLWNRRRVFLPEQPATGFTVARSEDSQEMQRLCRVYQVSDDEGRRLIRLFAELSVSEALEIPPKA